MNCNDIDNLLYDYVTERLDNKDRESVEIHLETCDICKGRLSMIQKTLPLLDYWSPPSLPADFADRVLEKIETQEKSLWQRIIDKVFFPMHYKLPLQGLAVAALIFLVVMIYRSGLTPEIEKTPREVTIETQIVTAKNPIIIDTRDIDSALNKLIGLIKANDGHLVRRKPIEVGMEVTFSIEMDKEETLFQDLTKLGEVYKEKEGYKDSEGNIVILLRKR